MTIPRILIPLLMLFTGNALHAQKRDTVYVTPDNMEISRLQEGKSVYLVYFRMAKDLPRTMTQFWTREVKRENSVLEITQWWEGKDSIVHTARSICDGQTFQPLFHETWWDKNGTQSAAVFDYVSRKVLVDGKDASQEITQKEMYATFVKATDRFTLNWHLDLEVLSVLPFALYKTFAVPFYLAGYREPQNIFYTVIDSGKLYGYDKGVIDCWILQHESPGNKELFWISKKTNEVLKLEQEVNGKMYRYKIRLGFAEGSF